MFCILAEVGWRASVTSTDAPNRVLDASVCRTDARRVFLPVGVGVVRKQPNDEIGSMSTGLMVTSLLAEMRTLRCQVSWTGALAPRSSSPSSSRICSSVSRGWGRGRAWRWATRHAASTQRHVLGGVPFRLRFR